MADCVNAGVDYVKASQPDTVVDRARAYPGGAQLEAGHDAVLPARKLGDERVDATGAASTLYLNVDAARVAHHPIVAAAA